MFSSLLLNESYSLWFKYQHELKSLSGFLNTFTFENLNLKSFNLENTIQEGLSYRFWFMVQVGNFVLEWKLELNFFKKERK